MHGAFAIVEHIDRLADSVPGIVELRTIGDLSRESIEPTRRHPQPDPWVPTDVPYPACDEIRARHRQRGWQKGDQVGTVTALDHPNALSPLFAGLASNRRQYCKSRRGSHEEARQHQGTEDCPIPSRPHQAPVLGRLRRRCIAYLPVPLVIIRRDRSIVVSCHSPRPRPSVPREQYSNGSPSDAPAFHVSGDEERVVETFGGETRWTRIIETHGPPICRHRRWTASCRPRRRPPARGVQQGRVRTGSQRRRHALPGERDPHVQRGLAPAFRVGVPPPR